MKISSSLFANVLEMDALFKDCGDVVKRELDLGEAPNGRGVVIYYIDMLVNREIIEDKLMKALFRNALPPGQNLSFHDDYLQTVLKSVLPLSEVSELDNYQEIALGLLSGDTVVFAEGSAKALVLSTKGWPNRGISAAETEVVVQGSKEAFNEVFRFSSVLIRRRIRDTNLKLVQRKVGRRSQTDVGVMYLEGVVRPKILDETLKRLDNIDIDGVLDSGYIEQFIEDDWISPFPQVQVTERPDKAASAILEGRIVIIVDNSPYVLIVPVTWGAFFQASEDYYQRFQIMSLTRMLRYIAAFLALALPALYLSTALFHPSMLPTLLTFKMAGARQTVPFPAVIEILLMDFSFELLREAGIRLPGPVGNTIGIVGGIIIGQAAVEAGLVSPIVVIIVALTGICSFSMPATNLVAGYRICKYLLIFTAAAFGLFGFWLGLLVILIHLVSLKSFGIPYMFPYASGDVNEYTDFKDSFFRAPLFLMKKRPIFANPDETIRLDTRKTGKRRKRE